MKWQPIETVRKVPNKQILLCRMHDGGVVAMGDGYWGKRSRQFSNVPADEGDVWCRGAGVFMFPEPTHWMPLPKPPIPNGNNLEKSPQECGTADLLATLTHVRFLLFGDESAPGPNAPVIGDTLWASAGTTLQEYMDDAIDRASTLCLALVRAKAAQEKQEE